MNFSMKDRPQSIERLKNDTFDLVVIGGGITGAGVALQAAASGLKTALFDMQDFSEGTSSRSTKLVHGGIRYLKQFDVEVVNDTVTERAVIQQIAPHIPKPETMLLPVYDEDGATFSLFRLNVAMNLYDSLAGVDAQSPYANHLLNREEVLQIQPDLSEENLVGGGLYLDFSNNDSRLVIENIKQAVSDGAIAVSRLKVNGFDYQEGKITHAQVEDSVTQETFSVAGNVFINATGPWSDDIRDLDTADKGPDQMRPTKGVHLVVDRKKLSVSQPTYFDTGEQDGRMIFVIPREDKTYFGTTDTDYEGDLEEPIVTQADVDYLLRIVNRRFPEANISQTDIESSWAGLRPLISSNQASDYNGGDKGTLSDEEFYGLVDLVEKFQAERVPRSKVEAAVLDVSSGRSESDLDPSQVSRGSNLTQSPSGLLTLAGGKITDYRKMAQGAMEVVLESLAEKTGRRHSLVNSKTYPVSGGRFNPHQVDALLSRFAKLGRIKGLTHDDAQHLADLYGSNTEHVLTYLDKARAYAEKYDYSEVVAVSLLYALDNEMVLTLSDFLTRRTNFSLFKSEEVAHIEEPVLKTMQDEFGFSDAAYAAQLNDYHGERAQMTLAHLEK